MLIKDQGFNRLQSRNIYVYYIYKQLARQRRVVYSEFSAISGT